MYTELQIRCIKLTSIYTPCIFSSPIPMFDHLLESSRWDDCNKWSNIGFGEEIGIMELKICSLSGALVDCTLFYIARTRNTWKSRAYFCIPSSVCHTPHQRAERWTVETVRQKADETKGHQSSISYWNLYSCHTIHSSRRFANAMHKAADYGHNEEHFGIRISLWHPTQIIRWVFIT